MFIVSFWRYIFTNLYEPIFKKTLDKNEWKYKKNIYILEHVQNI